MSKSLLSQNKKNAKYDLSSSLRNNAKGIVVYKFSQFLLIIFEKYAQKTSLNLLNILLNL